MLQQMIFFGIIYLVLASVSFRFKGKRIKSEADVRWRKRMAELWTYTFILHLNATLVTAHWHGYIRIWGQDLDEYVLLVQILCMVFYFLIHPVRKLVMTVYSAKDLSELSDFCLYLRPFSSDSRSRDEKRLCGILGKFWRVFAIGNPNSVLPNIWAARVYASDEQWKSLVGNLMARAHLIAYRIGDTDGARWELQHLISSYLEKTLFVAFSKKDYDLLVESCADICSFPPLKGEWGRRDKRFFRMKSTPEGPVWETCETRNKATAQQFVHSFVCEMGVSARVGLTETGQKRGIGTFLFGKGLMYGRIRTIVFCVVAAIITNIAAHIGYHVFNKDKYVLQSGKYGYLTISPAHLLKDSSIVGSRLKISHWSLRPQGDFALAAMKTDSKHHDILLFDLSQDNFKVSDGCVRTLCTVENLHRVNFNWDGNSILLFCGKNVHSFRFSDDGLGFDAEHLDFSVNVEHLPIASMSNSSGIFCVNGMLAISGEEGLFVYSDKGRGKMVWHEVCGRRYLDEIPGMAVNPQTLEIVYSDGGDELLFLNCRTLGKSRKFPVLAKSSNTIRFSPNGSTLAIANEGWCESIERRVCVFDVLKGTWKFNLTGHRSSVYSLEFAPDGKEIVTVSADGTIRIWDYNSGAELHRATTAKRISQSSWEQDTVFAAMNQAKTELLTFFNGELIMVKIK